MGWFHGNYELDDPITDIRFTINGGEEFGGSSRMTVYAIPQTTYAGRTVNTYEPDVGKTAAPAVTDDIDSGYAVGSMWIDETNDDAYISLNSTAGAAVWKKTTP
jgi:hypothetical protein